MIPAPLAWLTRGARSRLFWGLRPQTPYTLPRGGPMIPAPLAWLTRGARSLHTGRLSQSISKLLDRFEAGLAPVEQPDSRLP